MTHLAMAVLYAGLTRDEFPSKPVRTERTHVGWPRKRFNGSVGVKRELPTGKAVGKVTK